MIRRKGFTLIELLVVIAIIAILAAILFPVFARAREQARKTACLSNAKQLGTGIMMYLEDFDEMFPPGGYFDTRNNPALHSHFMGGLSPIIIGDEILPYVKNDQIFGCPSRRNEGVGSVCHAEITPDWGTWVVSEGYSLNMDVEPWAYPTGGAVAEAIGTPMAAVPNPAIKMLMAECPCGPVSGWDFAPWCPYFLAESGAKHGGINNVVFDDGHAKPTRVRALIQNNAWNALDTWPYDNYVLPGGVLKLIYGHSPTSAADLRAALTFFLNSYTPANQDEADAMK